MPTPFLDRLDHTLLAVRDMDATCAFYRRVLGMEVEMFAPGRTALRVGRQKINLEPARGLPADRPAPGPAHFCFISGAPLAEWIAHLAACGVSLLEGPVKRSGAEGPIDSLYLRDPDGNSIEIATYALAPAGTP